MAGLQAAEGGAQTGAQAGTGAEEYACARAWAALTAAHARITRQLSTALARACDLSINDFEILLRLEHATVQGLRLTELNAAISLTQPALSRAVARLGQRDWLSRAGAADDRRGVLITITPAGRDVLRSAVPVHAQTIRELLLDPLTPGEQDLLAGALSRVAATDQALTDPGPGPGPGPDRPGPGPDRPGPDRPGPGPDRPGPDRPGPDRPGPDRPGPERQEELDRDTTSEIRSQR
jgi:DNA-binding MarR family transcriptional regulator